MNLFDAMQEPEETDSRPPEVWLAMDAVAVLAAEVDAIGTDFLSLQERTRLAAVTGPRERSTFLAGRWLMRRLLARIHGGDPRTDWPLSATSDGAPAFLGQAFVQRPDGPWEMSIGQGGPYVACAVSSGRVAVDLQSAESERDALALVEVLCSAQELQALADMDDDARATYLQALRTIKEASIKCESARSDPGALRRLARRDISPQQWAGILHPEPTGRAPGGAVRPTPATAWTWQSDGLTLAVVVPGPDRTPIQWALPPPPFALQAPTTWTLQIAPDPLP
jgi:phosphopantetheinyl transferase